MKIKTVIIGIIVALLVGLVGTICVQHNTLQKTKASLELAVNNNKAYELENLELKDQAIAFKFTIGQINHSKDSLIQKLNQVRKDLKIKDKEVLNLQYLISENQKSDSIVFVHDTIFQRGTVIDTLIGDEWSRLALHAEYPNLLNVDYSFNNETAVVVHGSRVIVGTPKKCFIGRWFQKKQNIVEINVVQQNPYCKNKENKFIEVIK